jgi:hypothetical protein
MIEMDKKEKNSKLKSSRTEFTKSQVDSYTFMCRHLIRK